MSEVDAASELEEAREIARALVRVCPMYALPLDLMWRIQDTPRLSWVLDDAPVSADAT